MLSGGRWNRGLRQGPNPPQPGVAMVWRHRGSGGEGAVSLRCITYRGITV
jgi:hypothetical protein